MMKKWILFFFVFSTFFDFFYGQTIDAKKLDDEISSFNDKHLYEKSILRLQYILDDPRASHLDRYNAYLQKYFTYKRLSDFSTALEYLKAAQVEGRLSNKKDECESRVAVEELFIKIELQEFDEVKKNLVQNQQNINLKLLDDETQGFYFCTLAIIEIKENNFSKAEDFLDRAIGIFQKNNPRHLANIYRKKIDLYKAMGNDAKVVDAYEKGLFYAKKYNVEVYEKGLYESMSQYYRDMSDWTRADYYTGLSEKTSIATYKTLDQVGKLKVLEQKIKADQELMRQKYEERIMVVFVIILILTVLLAFYYYRQYRVNKKMRLDTESENQKILKELHAILQKTKIEETDLEIKKQELTERQLQIFELVKQGKTNKEIGMELYISENTVKYHLKSIYNILELENRVQLQR